MQTKPLLTIAIALGLAFLLVTAPGRADSLYQVDMILFATTDPSARTTERWPSDPGQPDLAGATKVGESASIAPRDGNLAQVWDGLDTSGRYRPLAYFRWRQAAGSAGRLSTAALESSVHVGKKGLPEVLGTVALSQDNSVQANVDVLFREMGPNDKASGEEAVKGYRLREQRRLQPGELHYLDHAILGVLIQITPVS